MSGVKGQKWGESKGQKVWDRTYYLKNRKRIIERNRKYYLINKEKVTLRKKLWRINKLK